MLTCAYSDDSSSNNRPADVNRSGWRFQYTSGYVGLVRVGPQSAAVLYDLMLPPPPPPRSPPPPPRPPAPPGKCTVHIHHTVGCFNDADGTLILSHYSPTPIGPTLSLESCAAACYALDHNSSNEYTLAGVDDGKSCFCGVSADVDTPLAKSRSVDKSECTGTPCEGSRRETECGGPGRLLAYQYSCDRDDHSLDDQLEPRPQLSPLGRNAGGQHNSDDMRSNIDAMQEVEVHNEVEVRSGHNPALSYSMRIDVL